MGFITIFPVKIRYSWRNEIVLNNLLRICIRSVGWSSGWGELEKNCFTHNFVISSFRGRWIVANCWKDSRISTDGNERSMKLTDVTFSSYYFSEESISFVLIILLPKTVRRYHKYWTESRSRIEKMLGLCVEFILFQKNFDYVWKVNYIFALMDWWFNKATSSSHWHF